MVGDILYITAQVRLLLLNVLKGTAVFWMRLDSVTFAASTKVGDIQ
jgi:hypothetical protein